MLKKQVELLSEKIRAAKKILVFGHKNPDGDSLGASLAMCHLIRDNFGKIPDVAYDGNLPITLDFLPGRKDIWFAEKLGDKKYDLFIAVDMGSKIQFGEYGTKLLHLASDSIKIDHHKTVDWNTELDFVDVNSSSTSEIIFDIATAAKWKINADAATCLCTGIYTDTGSFAFIDAPNNKPLLVAAQLINMGANMREITEGLKNFTKNSVIAEAEVLSRAEFFYGGRLAIASVSHKQYKQLDSGHTEIIFFLRQVKGVEAVAILKEARANEVGLSLRSRSVFVRGIAEKFGGGGHDTAAGARMVMNLADAKKTIVAEFKEIL